MAGTKKNEFEFDRSKCFTFFESYYEQAKLVEKFYGKEKAYDIYTALIEFALYETPVAEELQLLIGAPTFHNIEASQSRRSKSFGKEDVEMAVTIINLHRDRPELSQEKLAKELGISKGKVNKTLQKYAAGYYDRILEELQEKGVPGEKSEVTTDGHTTYTNTNTYTNTITNTITRTDRDRDRPDHACCGSCEPLVAGAPEVAYAPDVATLLDSMPNEIRNLNFNPKTHMTNEMVLYSMRNYCHNEFVEGFDMESFIGRFLHQFAYSKGYIKCDPEPVKKYLYWFFEFVNIDTSDVDLDEFDIDYCFY